MALEAVVAVAISVLAAIFLASLVILVVLCRHKYCKQMDLLSAQMQDTRPDVQLIDASLGTDNHAAFELDEVKLTHPNIEEILNDEKWIDDVTGFVPHCLSILKICHHLTENLVAMTMGKSAQIHNNKHMAEIVAAARRIVPRVDDMVRSMYPPMDVRLLDARATALILCVNHLVVVTKHACHAPSVLGWIDDSLAEMDSHHKILHDAAMVAEANMKKSLDQQQLLNNCHEASQL
ncbi:PREDICTED: transmembrane protein 98-like [Priapulus caudatus]|uniref:Transmembrane protein 98 n=1 Tax=Priapulus caudatus TaxID=37621 RepID=A0ABM1EJC8_PRICU|nr:PREDICTED: transmembrane protein 98-like [Priapulus caudatus]